ncbi:hypothetical protein HK100_011010, partial [Physocladia obscura]
GEWIGVELDQPEDGDNDGSVDGVNYFECQPGTGIFVHRDAIVKELDPFANPIIDGPVANSANVSADAFSNAAATASIPIIAANAATANYKIGDRVSVDRNGIKGRLAKFSEKELLEIQIEKLTWVDSDGDELNILNDSLLAEALECRKITVEWK